MHLNYGGPPIYMSQCFGGRRDCRIFSMCELHNWSLRILSPNMIIFLGPLNHCMVLWTDWSRVPILIFRLSDGESLEDLVSEDILTLLICSNLSIVMEWEVKVSCDCHAWAMYWLLMQEIWGKINFCELKRKGFMASWSCFACWSQHWQRHEAVQVLVQHLQLWCSTVWEEMTLTIIQTSMTTAAGKYLMEMAFRLLLLLLFFFFFFSWAAITDLEWRGCNSDQVRYFVRWCS